jgi:hypothetical protein
MLYPKITGKLNEQQQRLITRLMEGELSVNRFLKVGSDKLIPTPKHPEGEYLDKAAFESDFQNNLYGPNDLETWPRWGICGKDNLVLLDFDKKEIYDIMKTRLPDTFEVTSPRRGLPHRYYIVCGKQVPNLKFHIPNDTYINAKGATVKNPAGEIRADNHYLVAPGTTIRYEENGICKNGEYTITNDVPIARLEYDEFMQALNGYLMESAGERVLTDEKLLYGVSIGERHDTIFRYACRLIGDNPEGGFNALMALEMLERYNETKLFDEHGNLAPVEKDFCIRVIKEALDKAAKNSPYTVEQIAKQGFTALREKAKAQAVQMGIPEPKPEDKEEEGKTRESQAERVYKLFMLQNVELFHDQNKTEYARIPIGQHCKNNDTNDINGTLGKLYPSNILGNQTVEDNNTKERAPQSCEITVNIVNTVSAYESVRLKDEKFKTYLASLLYEAEQKVLNREAAAQVILLLKFQAAHGKCYNLYNRVAPDPSGDGSIWLDIADAENQAYHITKDGWTIEKNVPILFRRYEHQRPLAIAVHNGNAKKLIEFVNIGASKNSATSKHRQLLLLVQTASYLIPNIAHPVNAMFGCPGSHKSTAQRFIREIFDPSAAPLLRIPRDENAALQVLDHHYIPIFDNLDYLPRWLSDMICCAVTGTGQESRALYTDDDSFIRSFRRCIMLNGLNLPATKGDLLNRTIMHPTEPNVDRRTEQELNKKYAEILPEILGGFLDVAVKALKIKDTLKATKLFRLADFSEWGAALAKSLDESDKDFIEAMEENLTSQNAADIENNVVADAFLAYCTENLDLAGATEAEPKTFTPDKIFTIVTEKALSMGVNTKNSKRWPSAANSFSRKLNDSKSALIASGWNYEISHNGKSREMAIWRTEKQQTKHICYKECVYFDKAPCKHCGKLTQVSEQPKDCKGFIDKKDVKARVEAAYQQIIDLNRAGKEATEKTVGDPEAIKLLLQQNKIFETSLTGVYREAS